jgi:protein ImuB
LLFSGQNQRPLITACSPNAERLGLRIGQTLAEAKALLQSAVFLPADSVTDRDALRELALEAQRFSPLVGLEEGPHPESLFCEVKGCTHLWGGEKPFLEAVRDYWSKRGFQIQLALTSTMCASWALAHTSKISLVNAGDEEPALSGLSVAALRLPVVVLESLEALGLWTIGDVLRLPRESLASRFGAILPQRLGQALGLFPETFVCERLKEPLSVLREWEVPVDDRNALAFLCRQMLGELLSMAGRFGMGLQELEGELKAESGPVLFDIRLVEPTQDERHLAQLIDLQLERRTWPGGIVAVRWTALKLGRSEQAQGTWFLDEADTTASRAFNSLVDRLSSRLDAKAVLRVEIVPDAQPEHAVRLVPWMNFHATKTERFTLTPEQSRARPFRLLEMPQPIDVASVVPDGPPLRMVWQRQSYRVVRSWGPERIATGWWRAQDVERDYHRAEWEDGTHVWIYRDQRNGRWFLHGFFD